MDFHVMHHGTICLLTPLTPAAHDWVDTFLPTGRMYWGESVVVEPRYLDNIARGIEDDGLSIEGGF